MGRECNLVYFRFILEVFREDDFVYTCTILWLLLQTLLNYHVEVFGDALRDRRVLLRQDFLFELLYVLCIIGVFLCAHFIQDNA